MATTTTDHGTPGPRGTVPLRTEPADWMPARLFPTTRAHVLDTLQAGGAPDELVRQVAAVPIGSRFASPAELLAALDMVRRPAVVAASDTPAA